MSAARHIGAIARVTLTEAVRQRFFVFVVLISVALVGGSLFLREFNFGSSELKFLTDIGLGVLTFFGSLIAVVLAAQLFFSEIENRTALTILARPVRRSEFVAGKFLGTAVVLLVFVAVASTAMLAVLWWRETVLMSRLPDAFPDGRAVDYGSLAVLAVLQWGKFCVIAAITLLVASYAQTNLFTTGLSFTVVVAGHLQHVAARAWERDTAVVTRVAGRAVGVLLPDFQLYNLGDLIAAGHSLVSGRALVVGGYSLTYVVVVLALAVFSFRHREI